MAEQSRLCGQLAGRWAHIGQGADSHSPLIHEREPQAAGARVGSPDQLRALSTPRSLACVRLMVNIPAPRRTSAPLGGEAMSHDVIRHVFQPLRVHAGC